MENGGALALSSSFTRSKGRYGHLGVDAGIICTPGTPEYPSNSAVLCTTEALRVTVGTRDKAMQSSEQQKDAKTALGLLGAVRSAQRLGLSARGRWQWWLMT